MPASDPQPTTRPGFLRRLLSADTAILAMLALGITVATGVAGYAATNHFTLSADIHQTHARIDTLGAGLNARIDTLNSDLSSRIQQTNTRIDTLQASIDARFDRMDARFDRLFVLLNDTMLEHSRRLDAIESQLANRPAPTSGPDTP